jgi:hypothetical protein
MIFFLFKNRGILVPRRGVGGLLKKSGFFFPRRGYGMYVQDQLKKGIIDEVKPNKSKGTVHYLVHHDIITPQKTTTKLRVVYDASAKTSKENNSLNDCLCRDPVMVHDLCGILLRFRKHPIAIVAAIERAFLQIELQRDQRDVTRFLWLKDVGKMYAMCRREQQRRIDDGNQDDVNVYINVTTALLVYY